MAPWYQIYSRLETGLPLDQPFTTYEKITLKGIKLYVYVRGSINGSIKLSLISNGTAIATKTISSTDINTATQFDYNWGFLDFSFDDIIVMMKGDYTLRLEGVSGYFVSTAWFGWGSEYEGRVDIGPIVFPYHTPLSFRLINYKRV